MNLSFRRALPSIFIAISILLCLLSIAYFLFSQLVHQARFNGVQNQLELSNQNAAGGLVGTIDSLDTFGERVDNIGDLDGDGIEDIVVGGFANSAYVIFLNRDGSAKSSVRIAEGLAGFSGTSLDNFGSGVANIGDLDGDGVTDLAIGEMTNNGAGDNRGAIWILFMNTDGTVKSDQLINDTTGGFGGTLSNDDFFGRSVAGLGDLDGDEIEDIVVGASGDTEVGSDGGALWVLFLDTDGTVKSEQKINEINGGFGGEITGSGLGLSVDNIGDVNLDGVTDIAAGAVFDTDGGTFAGAVWTIFLDTDGTVQSEQKISQSNGIPDIGAFNTFGTGVTPAGGDLNGDGIRDIVVGGGFANAIWAVYLNRDGTAKGSFKISETLGGFSGAISGTTFGISVTDITLHSDGAPELYVGAREDSTGGASSYGAVWYLALDKENLGGTDFITPKSEGIRVNGGVSCVASRDVFLSLDAIDAKDVVVGADSNFIGFDWEPYVEPSPMLKEWTLPDEDGIHTIYALYRSKSRNQSILDFTEVTLDRVNNCGIPIEPVCEDRCEDLRFQFFIVTPLGEEITSESDRVRIIRQDGVERIYFEDKDDYDFNDVAFEIDQEKCHTWSVKQTALNAGWHHQVGVRVFHQGIEVAREIFIEDTHLATGKTFAFDSSAYYPICSE